jgi:hypothetical protein
MGELLIVDFDAPSHEFTFNVDINLIFDLMVPIDITSSLLHVIFGVCCLCRI